MPLRYPIGRIAACNSKGITDRITPIPRPAAGAPPVNSAAAWTYGPPTTSLSASSSSTSYPKRSTLVIRALFPTKNITACALPVRGVKNRGTVYQVFSPRGAPQEGLRLRLGHNADGQLVKWWRNGIQNRADCSRYSILRQHLVQRQRYRP